MKTKTNNVLEAAEKYVASRLENESPETHVYHGIDHTKQVVSNAILIAEKENMDEKSTQLLILAAWFHDLGYLIDYENHEQKSAAVAKEFLSGQGLDEADIQLISAAIMATKFPQTPESPVAKALCDADMMHLTSINFFDLGEKLRQEWKMTAFRKLKKKVFYEHSLFLLKEHRFFTNYGIEVLEMEKEKNLKVLEKILSSYAKSKPEIVKQEVIASEVGFPKKITRGVDTMFKLTARNQINLSAIADNKSNILISINAIIISLVITMLVRRFEENPVILLPAFIFLFFSLATIVLAILATRPHLPSGKFKREDIEKMKVNLLFFGNFYKMEQADYEWALHELIKKESFLYTALIKDQYYLGKVLAKKYSLLRAAFVVFMIGLIVSVLAFIIISVSVNKF